MFKNMYVDFLADIAQLYLDMYVENEKILIEEYPTGEPTIDRLKKINSVYERECKRIAFLRKELKND